MTEEVKVVVAVTCGKVTVCVACGKVTETVEVVGTKLVDTTVLTVT